MYVPNLYLKIVLCHLAIRTSESWRPFIFEMKSFTTQSFSKAFDINSTILNNELSVYVNIRENLPNLHCKLALTFESTNDVYDMEFINRTIDLCQLFRNKRYEPILQIFYRIFSERSGTTRNCPIKKKMFIMKNVAMNAENFPPVMPNKKGFFDANLLVKYGKEMKTISRVVMYFEFKNANIKGKR